MGSSIGELHGQVWNELGAVGDYFHADEAHRAIVQTVNIRTAFTRNSSVNVLLAKTDVFEANLVEIDITSKIGFGVPLWIEEQTPINPDFVQMRTINMAAMSEFRKNGIRAAAFWSEEPNDTSSPVVRMLTFSIIPNTNVRIWFDRDLVSTIDSDLTRLPAHIDDLLVKEAENILIPKIKLRMGLDLGREEKRVKDVAFIARTLDELYQQNRVEIVKLDKLWQIWAFRARDTETSFNRPTPNSRWLYPEDNFYY